jgi:hypothetical protein
MRAGLRSSVAWMAWISANVRAPMTSTYRAGSGARIPEGVRGPAGHDHRTSGRDLVNVLTCADPQRPLQHVPGFVFCVLVQRRLIDRLIPGATWCGPLREHEPRVSGSKRSSGKLLRSEFWHGVTGLRIYHRSCPQRDRMTAHHENVQSWPRTCHIPRVVVSDQRPVIPQISRDYRQTAASGGIHLRNPGHQRGLQGVSELVFLLVAGPGFEPG